MASFDSPTMPALRERDGYDYSHEYDEDKLELRERKREMTRGDCVASVVWFLIGMWANCFTNSLAHFRMPDPRQQPPLHDVGFQYIPILRLQWITDAMLAYFNVGMILLYCHAYYYMSDLDRSRRIWIRYFLVWGTCMCMRSISIWLTSLPAAENHCQDPQEIHDVVWNAILGFITFGGGNIHCGDLLFSGHTINLVNGFWQIRHWAKKEWWPLVWLNAAIVAMCMFIIIASRSHYTIDVYIATCITTLTFKCVPEGISIQAVQPIAQLCNKYIPDWRPKGKPGKGGLNEL